jgi:ABC-type nitrate/sulfonate/bicarbonate transport system ATPase subunit
LAKARTSEIAGVPEASRLQSMNPERDPSKLCKLAIDIEGLTLRITDRVLIEGFNFQLPAGSRVGITGPSGCGKTTFLRNIVGRQITPPSSAVRVNFCGDRVGYVPQQGRLLPWYSLRRNVEVFAQHVTNRKEWCDNVLEVVELEDVAGTRPERLSGGELQRARLACAIASQPALFCADEPLTEVGIQQKWRLLRKWSGEITQRSASLLLVSHDVETLFYLCDELIVLGGPKGQPATQLRTSVLPAQPHPRVPGQLNSQSIEAFRQSMSQD